MTRRIFCSIVLFFSWAVGCSKPKAPTTKTVAEEDIDELRVQINRSRGWNEPTLIDPVARVAQHIERATPSDGVQFDPLTLLAIASAICSILSFCIEANAARIQRAVTRYPGGQVATRLRGKLRSHYITERLKKGDACLFYQGSDVEAAVQSTMKAFARAQPEQIKILIRDLRERTVDDRDTSDRVSSAAYEWSRLE